MVLSPLGLRPKVAVNYGITLKVDKPYLYAVKRLYRGCDKVICVGYRLREEVRSVLGVYCEVVPLPMKLDLYKPRSISEREDIVVHIGTRPVKNPHISIEALKLLRRRGFNTKLIVIGASSEHSKDESVE
jgi:glycosyltransferase involved in cell wall biosynthesis